MLTSIAPDKRLSFSGNEMQAEFPLDLQKHRSIKQVLLNASLGFTGCGQN